MTETGYWSRLNHGNTSRRRFIRGSAGLALGAAAFALVGCGDDDDATAPGAPSTPSGAAPTPGAAPAGEPTRGGTLTVPARTEPVHLDLAFVSLYAIQTVWGQVYNGLLRMSSGADVAPNAAVLQPDLPGQWEQPDSLTYIFKLNQPVSFQDVPPVDGRPMTAEDIKYSFDRFLQPEVAQIARPLQLASVESVDAVDDETVRFNLNRPDAVLASYLADNRLSVVPRELVEEEGDLRRRAVGTGPFIFSDWAEGTSISLTKNPSYWDEGKPYLDEIRVLRIGDYSTQQSQFIAGALDVISQIEDPLQAQAIAGQAPDAIVEEWITRSLTYGYKVNGRVDGGRLADIRTRQAIGAAYNRDLSVQTVYGGSAVTSGTMPPAWVEEDPSWAVPLSELGPAYTYDPQTARQLLEAAGTVGVEVEIAVSGAQHGPQSTGNGAFLQENLREVGFNARVYDAPAPEFTAHFGYNPDGNYDIMRAAVGTSWDISDVYLGQANYAITGTGDNDPDFDPNLLPPMLEYRTILDPEERREKGFEIQKYIGEQADYILAEANIYRDYWRPYVHNFRPSALWTIGWGSRNLREVWLDR